MEENKKNTTGNKITRKELISKYLDFFKNHKEYSHTEIPNASLIPSLDAHDTGVLFTTAGMHPLVPFLLGEKHPKGKRLVNFQKCIRTGDIEEVGDSSHHTFFEMLGNWSLGDYWKEEAIQMSYEFLTEILKILPGKLGVTCFAGSSESSGEEGNIPKDTESSEIWKSMGIPEERIAYTKDDNWWGPAGSTGPCGPDTEMFYFKSTDKDVKEIGFDPDDEKNWVEIWNDVLMQYNKVFEENENKEIYKEAKQKNIDTGMGLERTLAVLNGLEDDYETEVFKPIIEKIEKISEKKYSLLKEGDERKKAIRIIADHIKASVFIIADGVFPGNSEQGYVLRRLIRRAIKYGRVNLNLPENFVIEIAKPVFEIYDDYSHIQENKEKIISVLKKEEEKFNKTLEKGIKEFNKISNNTNTKKAGKISGKDAFLLYQSYGFPLEMTKELANEKNLNVNENDFNEEYKKHQQLSKTASSGKFKSGLADNTEETTKLHTTTHLLNQALREVLQKPDIYQKGSNINPERLRFDFNFSRKLTEEEKEKVEEWVNDKIKKALPVEVKEMTPEEAESQGAIGVFDNKYGDKVKVYFIGPDKSEGKEKYVSKEICAGPHVKNTNEIGEDGKRFKIKKEESSSSGVRRIKGVLV